MMKSAWLILLGACGVAPTVTSHDIVESSGDRLKIEWWELADGHQQVRGVWDAQLGTECRFERQADGTYACGDVRLPLDIQPSAPRVVPTSVCTNDGFVLPIGLFDTERGVECTPKQTATGELRCTQLAADPSIDDPIVAIDSVFDDERLEAQYVTSDDGTWQHLPSFFDTALASPCSVRAATTDATAFCMPSGELRAPMDQFVAAIPTVEN
jgi:hypothetical protein